jgi:hypothetical protein
MRSANNALKHGLTARTAVVLHSESEQLYQQRLDDLFARFQPADACESLLVEEMAGAQWRPHRVWTFETSLVHAAIPQNQPDIGRTFDPIDHATRAALALKHLTNNSNALSAIHRQATRLSREYERARRQLNHLQDRRRAQSQLVQLLQPPATEGKTPQ